MRKSFSFEFPPHFVKNHGEAAQEGAQQTSGNDGEDDGDHDNSSRDNNSYDNVVGTSLSAGCSHSR